MVPRHYGIRTQRYKLMHFYQFGEEWELYDLKKDPDELTNLYGNPKHQKLAARLKKQEQAELEKRAAKTRASSKPKGRTRESAGEAFLKSMARAAGSSVGRKLFRGILGSLLK